MKLLFILPLLLLSGCSLLMKDPEPDLPPETQTGAFTFACRVNGEVWTFKPSTNPGHIDFDADYNGDAMYVIARGYNGTYIKIDFSEGITDIGEYALWRPQGFEAFYDHREKGVYLTDSLTNGILTMTRLDLENSIISGRFHFNAVNSSGDTVRVTDGRFDIKYRYP